MEPLNAHDLMCELSVYNKDTIVVVNIDHPLCDPYRVTSVEFDEHNNVLSLIVVKDY